MRSTPEAAVDMLQLWTIQPKSVWERAQDRGGLRTDGRLVDPYFRPAYRWMIGQMAQRLTGYTGMYPVWAWYRPKPDLRHTGYLTKGTPGVRLGFIAPADKVLLSDFDAWHSVLNGGYCAPNAAEAEWCAHYEACDRATVAGDAARLEALRRERPATWERIFDLDAWAVSNHPQYIQATLASVALSQITDVTHFTAR